MLKRDLLTLHALLGDLETHMKVYGFADEDELEYIRQCEAMVERVTNRL